MGEPSSAFFPPALNSEEEAVVFPAEKRKKDNPKKLEEKGTIATAEDIKNRHKEQMERYIEYEHNVGHPASLPIGWMRYGVKHWEEIQRMKGNSITLSSPESSLPS
ncbi:MAG: hypothetical protein M1450_01330 [Patescibacteria group bacterium]|nr:hypothetical protein [Patescibacteria group bacterium]